jgi:hypothetical protein
MVDVELSVPGKGRESCFYLFIHHFFFEICKRKIEKSKFFFDSFEKIKLKLLSEG